MTYLSPELVNQGYTGVTGTTPYQPGTAQQIATLQAQYANALSGRTLTASSPSAVQINVNFDGTQNNRTFPAEGESMTNIGQIAGLQEKGADQRNTIYMSGIGAQTVPSGTTDANGYPVSGSSPSSWESTPWKAGEIGSQILENAYSQLTTRVSEILAVDPMATIDLNLAGFSRGGAEAVAFANLLSERGIPGLYEPGQVPINSMVLFDPVDRSAGELNVSWPTNLNNPALVFVATAENRMWFPAMPVDTGSIIVPIEAVHADTGGSFNSDGISAVTLKIARDYLTAVGSPMDAIPADFQPNWDRMVIHNSAIDNYGNQKFGTVGEITQTVGTNRYYEGSGLGSLTVKDILGRDISVVPVYESRNGTFTLAGFVAKTSQTSTDETTGNTTVARDIVTYARDGKTITAHVTDSITRDDAGQIVRRTATDYAADGQTVAATRSMEWLDSGNLQTTTRDGSGNLVSIGEKQTYEDGSTSETVNYADGRVARTNTDGNGNVTSRAVIETDPIDGGSTETVTYADGRKVKIKYDSEGNLTSQEDVTDGLTTVTNAANKYGPAITDALSIMLAIKNGQPLPMMTSTLKLANDLNTLEGVTNANLSGTANVASGIMSLMSLDAALKGGDDVGAITAGAQAISFGATAYANFVGYSDGAAGSALQQAVQDKAFGAASDAIGMVGQALPYLSIINSIAHGDMTGAAIGVVSMCVPVIGWAYAIYSVVSALLDDGPPDPWGSGQYTWDGNGIGYQTAGETGGNEAVSGVMKAVVDTLNTLIERERQQNPGSALGIIPNRMPTVGYDMSGFRYTDIDPLTGAEKHPALRFDTSGRPYNAATGSPESYQSIIEGMLRSALTRGAIAPMWEVETAKMQTDAGDPQAGLTEEERAGRSGHLAAPIAGANQTFRPVVIDLDGDGIETTGAGQGVAFDVDDSGYLKNTAWVKGDDGFLVLDRNTNGSIDSGKELFSNGTVDLSKRGLGGMAWVDANYDGRITSADLVWNELKVWQDVNQDGVQQTGETRSLADLGITELDYAMGTYTRNGVKQQLASPDLQADKDGTRINVVPEGILVQTSNDGKMSLLVSRIDDKTAVDANRDGITGFEDVETIVSTTDLLANDNLGGFAGRDLAVTGVTNFRHGTGFLDANGFVHFNPEANYAGSEAGFDYSVQASNGQTGSAAVDITLQNVNDAPTATDQRIYRPIYGYTPVVWVSDGESGSTRSGGDPIYVPYAVRHDWGWDGGTDTIVYDPPAGQSNMTYHTTPVAQEDTGDGRVVGSDIDDPASSLTYELLGGPQYGAVTVDANGNYDYTSWRAPGVPSSSAGCNLGTINPGTDAFQVKVTDPHGASTIMTITVPHPGPYQPPTPPGGGGGCCPVAVDLDRNGFSFTPAENSNVFFDINADGWKRQVSWTKPGDGWLAYDANGNGKVDDGSEIVFSRYAKNAQGDLQSLAEAFDSNHDGLLSAADEKWAKFGVWQDVNQNGVNDSGEFRTLADMGVVSVGLVGDGTFSVQDGNTVHGISKITFKDGTTLDAADVTLRVTDEVRLPASDGGSAVTTQSPFSPSGEEIDGTDGNDLILGKNGNNIVKAGAGDDAIFEDGGNDIIDGGNGNDLIYSGADNDLVMGGAGDDAIYAGLGNDVVLGGDGHDAIFAEGGNDVVFGGDGNDLISGGAGNDVLSGDAGDDRIYGESGNDALFGGAGNDELSGMDGNDRLDGGLGNDLLDGGTGADEMIGGAGDDIYVVDDAADTVTELAGEGVDTVRTTLGAYTLGANIENLTLSGSINSSGYGNELDNVLIGNLGNNMLVGGAGSDKLDGGQGSDTLIGGTGDDIYVVDNAGDQVVEVAGEGVDAVKASVSFVLSANVENLTLTGTGAINATGNELDNHLVGNAGDNTLDGGFGADTMVGGRGNDTYVVDQLGDVVLELANEGIDSVVSGISYTLGANVENLILAGTADLTGTGNDLANAIAGNSGNNVLDGGAGADTLAGGAGNDIYIVDNAGDTVTEGVDAGTDTVFSSVTYTLSANVENVTLTGFADIDATGNELGNVLIGNAGSNRLDGGVGADAMAGGAGNDTYIVDNLGDTVAELLDGGFDAVYSSVSFVLPEHVENLALTGSAAINGTGNALDNALLGNDAANVLDGAAGADDMAGGGGDDIYYVDTAGDRVTEAVDGGYDTVRTTISLVTPDNVEQIELLGNANIDATGNVLANVLIGNSGANRLDGGQGADTMKGGAGDDVYIVDDIADAVVEAAGEGTDSVLSSVCYTLAENVENLTLTGSANVDGTGNSLDNVLTGNGGRNVLDGGTGADAMSGGAGDDDYIVDNASDTVIEFAFGGVDTIYTSVSYVLPEHVENLILTGDGNIGAGGNGSDNQLTGNAADNLISGGGGNDLLDGQAGNDTLDGGQGNDVLIGGTGNDTYLINIGDGLDRIDDVSGTDTVRFGAGLSLDNVALRITGSDGAYTAHVRVLNGGGCEQSDQGFDFAVTVDHHGRITSPIERFEFADGSVKELDDLLIKTRVTHGSWWSNTITTGRDDDIIVSDWGGQVIRSGSGNDIVFAGIGGNTVYGEGGNDYLQGSWGNDVLDGGCGNDVLAGSLGQDVLRDSGGNNALFGGWQNDRIEAGAGNDFIAGGKDDDTIQAGGGANVIAFNWGDGRDVVLPSAGASNTLSLGGGIEECDLSFTKSGQNLVLSTGWCSQITLKDWYASASNQTVDKLQVVEAVPYSRCGQNTSGWNIDIFDFKALVQRFDAARVANPKLSQWRLMNGLLDAHLESSDSAALGGELATRYADGGESAISLGAAQTALKDANFGSQAQTVGRRFDATVCDYRLG